MNFCQPSPEFFYFYQSSNIGSFFYANKYLFLENKDLIIFFVVDVLVVVVVVVISLKILSKFVSVLIFFF
jgi:hypothetical protein